MKDALQSEDLRLSGSLLAGLGSVGTLSAGASEVGTAEIANDAVTTTKIASGAVLTENIGSSNITTNLIGSSAVVAANIAANAVTSAKILAANVLTAAIGSSNVTTNEIASGAVVTANIGAAAVTTAVLGSQAVTFDRHKVVASGSPATYGYTVATGRALLAGGSTWVTFSAPFKATPLVTVTPEMVDFPPVTGNNFVGIGSLALGSFFAVGSTVNSGSFAWMAIGSGQA